MVIREQSIERPDVPPVKKVIRALSNQWAFLYHKQDTPEITELCEITYSDIRGKVPAGLLNMIVATEYYKEFAAMNKYINSQKQKHAQR